MLEVEELSRPQIVELLDRIDYGHLACSLNDLPYVIPVHFVHDNGEIFVYTTEGKKSRILSVNPRVCLQFEEVIDNQNWVSVIVDGEAARVTDHVERERILALIAEINPTLTPAVSIHWMDNWIRENIEVIYRIVPLEMNGRRAVRTDDKTEYFVSKPKNTIQ
ncbi:MAG TPA: pyridoxamine 5'-phosphate oxidase family protein [Pyrinomonadaceae bacterium]|nr:pyridoxamine 5'-phosphate oxidase family protein [Chloracidobacterium sp.]MBP9934989.1 pyridoxamine 5'-phosphate oxidase family protein [Pyrinomonadaceae bacterium]MBK7801385.1 pyridoxamine 5'-phosphate oxidase family protein [Chloracidobacterium sp.]MBK9436704.1 pyridoxamine 5'-phosphate oxidase family protein [Chloracidobacterium sp.]MBL0241694.1 pyridoxamine 5'-phosphate oxidase family protein [Chloracidobacterium sp.]